MLPEFIIIVCGCQVDPVYNGQYNQQQLNRGTRRRGPINDQISLSLSPNPSTHIGNVNTGTDYSWRISGFTQCSAECGGGN